MSKSFNHHAEGDMCLDINSALSLHNRALIVAADRLQQQAPCLTELPVTGERQAAFLRSIQCCKARLATLEKVLCQCLDELVWSSSTSVGVQRSVWFSLPFST